MMNYLVFWMAPRRLLPGVGVRRMDIHGTSAHQMGIGRKTVLASAAGRR